MPDIIHLLPDSVANQIAAGEVIQRPASLIKELVENSIDAGADRIQVIVTDAGKTCVQVIDNGKGMSETDARLSFERHATSKIRQADDLFSLKTMGFRGEALASIAAVAQVELRTRTAEDELGVSIQIEGSKVINQEVIACPVGANFSIKNLFFNIPARRKFLKSNHTELSNIVAEFERIALAHPELTFQLHTPDAVLLDLPSGNFRQRIVNIFGRNTDKHLIPLKVETPMVSIVGFVGSPESSKKKGARQFFFVNGRYMRHPYFAKAVQNAYERLIPDGDQVQFFLQMVVDPARIDVNIHPTKTEIKFEDEQAIWQILRAAVRESLGKFNAIPTIDFEVGDPLDLPVFPSGDFSEIQEPSISIDQDFNPFLAGNAGDISTFSAAQAEKTSPTSVVNSFTSMSASHSTTSGPSSPASRTTPARGWEEAFSASQDNFSTPSFGQPATASSQSTPFQWESPTEAEVQPTLYSQLGEGAQQNWEIATQDFLQYKGRYLLSPSNEGLLIIDQHRAHMRILFDEYVNQITKHTHAAQGLLFPQIIEVAPNQLAIIQTIEKELNDIGFDLSYLGNNSYSVLSAPAGIDGIDPVILLQSILEDAQQHDIAVHEEVVNSIALSMARKSALPIGQLLSTDEMRDLATKLFQSNEPSFAPDGKTIFQIVPHRLLTQKLE